MVLILDKKPLEGRWWKYALIVIAIQMTLWFMQGFKLNPEFGIWYGLKYGYYIYGTFAVFAVLPFAVGRLGLKRLFWFTLIGFVLADVAYFTLSFFEPVVRLNSLLPIIGFAQIATTFFFLGGVVEMGRYVYIKVFEE